MPPLKGEAARRGEGVLLKGEQRPEITKTINGTTTDVVSVATIKSALGSFTWGALAGQ